MRTCKIEGCGKKVASRELGGICNMHYSRLKRTGTTDTYVHKPKPVSVPYKRIWAPNLIISASNGKCYEHRAVLFGAIGYGPHKCEICGTFINWGSGLEVDHLDRDRGNNHLSNLRALCVPCNRALRSWYNANDIRAAA